MLVSVNVPFVFEIVISGNEVVICGSKQSLFSGFLLYCNQILISMIINSLYNLQLLYNPTAVIYSYRSCLNTRKNLTCRDCLKWVCKYIEMLIKIKCTHPRLYSMVGHLMPRNIIK